MATDNARLILDGSHRIKELKPEFLIIDYLRLHKGDERYFADLIQFNKPS